MVEVSGAQRSQKNSNDVQQTFSRVAGRWLRWQCQLLNDVQFAAVIDATGLKIGAGIPSQLIVAAVGEAKIPLIAAGDPAEHLSFTVKGLSCWQVPVNVPGKSIVVVLHMGALSSQAKTAADRLLQWGTMNLTDWLADAHTEPTQSLPPLQLMLSQKTLELAAARWVDDVQFRTQATRVSVGWFEGGRSQLLAMSGVTALDARRALPRALVAAMSECVQAKQSVQYPADMDSVKSDLIKHKQLHQRHGEQHILSLPLISAGNIAGVLMLELKPKHWRALPIEALHEEVAMATPILATLSERKPGVGLFLKRCTQKLYQLLLKPASATQKKISYTALGLMLLTLIFPFSRHATIRGEIQGADRQVLAATHQGFLKSASARAGDQVHEGQVLAQFDHTQMQLERDTWVSELTRIDSALVQAMTSRDRPAIGRLRAEQSSAKAELELIDHQITQADVIAPFDGILVSGDLDDQLGSSVEAGQALFQIASLNDYTLQLQVPEHQATKVSLGSTGDMRFAALPSAEFTFEVESTVPIAVPDEGKNTFRMQAKLHGNTEVIRPGMTGVAKVDIGRRSLVLRALDFTRERLHYWWWSIGA